MSDPPPPPKNRGWSSQEIIWLIAVPMAVALVVCTFTFGWLVDNATVAMAPTPTVTVTASPVSTTTAPSKEDQFVVTVRERTNRYDISSTNFVGLGHAICTDLDDGKSLMVAMSQLYDDGLFSAEDSGAIVAAAIFYLCPRHLPSNS